MTLRYQIEQAKNELSHYRNSKWREHQVEAIEWILNSDKKYVFLEAPTGAGKSIIGIISAMCSGGANYSVHSKTLQHQITSDFPEARSLFGRNNYECIENPAVSCAECFHTKEMPCKAKGTCLYEVKKKEILAARLRILNYDYLISECNYIGKFSGHEFNVIDEADNLENTLIEFVTLTFTTYSLSKLGLSDEIEELKKSSKDKVGLVSSWKQFCHIAHERATEQINKLDTIISTYTFPPTEEQGRTLKEKVRLVHLIEKINLFVDNVDDTWLYDDSQEDKYIFRPLWLNEELGHEFMWRHSNKWLLMSASFLPLHIECKRLGIPIDETDYKILPSTFPKERRPIHVESCANLTAKTMEAEVPKLISRIKQIVDDRPQEKGLIHAVSFKLARDIYEGVQSDRLVIHDSTNRQSVLEDFMESDEPRVLISPSLERGVSLSMDLCRFVIVAKAPFLYLGNKIVSARVYSSRIGNEWYSATMLLTVLQMCGRGMRSKDDYCECVIPSTKTLNGNLQWVEIGTLKKGDKIFSFDEEKELRQKCGRDGWTKSNPRKFRFGEVENIKIEKRNVYRIILKNGEELFSTHDHRWLVRGKNQIVTWKRTDELHTKPLMGRKTTFYNIVKLMNTWESIDSFDSGWLSGITDGEGCICLHTGNRNRFVPLLTIVQNEGVVLNKIIELLNKYNFKFNYNNRKSAKRIILSGGIKEILRFLGQIKPVRLLDKFKNGNGGQCLRTFEDVEIEKIEEAGMTDVAILQTSTKTYFANGYGAHNCFILDEQFQRVFQSKPSFLPEWWKEAVTW